MGLVHKIRLDLMDRLVNSIIKTSCKSLTSEKEEESDVNYDSEFNTGPVLPTSSQYLPQLEEKLFRQLSIGVSDPQAIENIDPIKKNYSLDWDILVCLTNSDGISFPPAWSHMATAKKADRRNFFANHCKATDRQLQVIAPLISPLVLERADTLEWRIENQKFLVEWFVPLPSIIPASL